MFVGEIWGYFVKNWYLELVNLFPITLLKIMMFVCEIWGYFVKNWYFVNNRLSKIWI